MLFQFLLKFKLTGSLDFINFIELVLSVYKFVFKGRKVEVDTFSGDYN